MPDFPLYCRQSHLLSDAQDIAQRFDLHLTEQQPAGLALILDESGLQLSDLNDPKTGGVQVDFASATLTWRRQQGGGLKEAVARAVGVKGNWHPRVLDATAGLGRDSFILASLGCQVTMSERHPVVAALLSDGLRRAALSPGLAALCQRLDFRFQAATSLIQNWSAPAPDVIYLDPMFPHRKKSAAVKKDMRLFQQLLGPDKDADSLLPLARALATKRVVVKRPANAPWLNDTKPDIEQKGKANRFDIYLIHATT